MESLLRTIVTLLIAACCVGAEYHVDPAGDDTADGSKEAPWKTLERVNAHGANPGFKPGDAILLASGETFTGGILLQKPTTTTKDQPLIIASTGEQPAIIRATASQAGIETFDLGGLDIRNLHLIGVGGDKHCGITLLVHSTGGERYPAVSLKKLRVEGFGKAGISVGSWDRSYPGFDGILIQDCIAERNGANGITIYDSAHKDDVGRYAHRNVRIERCEASANGSGSGIVVCGIDGGVIEHCRTYKNHGKSGNCGLWAYSCRKVVIQYCISHENTTQGKDGCGFDIDGGCESCVLQYCYSYGNDGHGAMHCDYPNSRATINNVIRYCISENDGRKKGRDSGMAFVTWGEGIADCVIEHCVIRVSSKSNGTNAGMGVDLLTGFGKSPNLKGCIFRNNIVWVEGETAVLASVIDEQAASTRFIGNVYWNGNGGSPRWEWMNETITELALWRSKGHEVVDGQETGCVADPLFTDLAGMGPLTDTRAIAASTAYRPRPGSPIRGAGMPGALLPGIMAATVDLGGSRIRVSGRPDAGAYVVP